MITANALTLESATTAGCALRVIGDFAAWLTEIFACVISGAAQALAAVTAEIGSSAAAAVGREHDAVLVQSAKSGDKRAFADLVRRHQDMIYTVCARLLCNRTDGEDAAQETFVKAFEALSGFKGEAAFSTWLYRIAVNVCRNRRASFWSRLSARAVRIDADVDDEDGAPREIPGNLADPHEVLARKGRILGVRRAIAKLPAKHREIVVLADIQELTYEEIQGITALALGTVKSRLARAREALKCLLKDVDHAG